MLKLWKATYLSEIYGYKDLDSFKKVIQRAVEVLYLIDVPYWKHIYPIYDRNNKKVHDFELSRFACFIAAMEADDKKSDIEEIQKRIFKSVLVNPKYKHLYHEVDRIKLRKDLSDAFNDLNKTARRAGVKSYPNFMEAGYEGMYNMRHENMLTSRNLPKKGVLYDHIGKLELSFHIQKIIFIENSIRGLGLRGQKKLETAHHQIGADIRTLIKRNSGLNPEQFKIRESLPDLVKDLKKIQEVLSE
jgi:DNA-damage-inducible protein D